MPILNLNNLQQFTAVQFNSDPGAIGGPYIVPNCARIVLYLALEDGKIAHLVLVGRYVPPFAGTNAQANGIFTALSTGAAWTGLAAFLATSTQFQNVTIQNVDVAGAPTIPNTAGAPTPGTSASPALPNEVSVVITKRSGFIGRQNRGRIYFPGFATNALGAGNVVAAAAVTALQTWANGIGPALTAQGYTHAIGQPARSAYTGKTGTLHPARAKGSVDVTSVTVRDNHWDSQRRRGLK